MPIGIQEKRERDSLDKFMDSLKEDREVIQETKIPDPEPSDTLPGIDDVEQLPDPVVENRKLELSQIPAKTIVDVVDTAAVSLNSYIAQERQDGASEEEKKTLQDSVANYLKDTDIDISPGKLVLVLVLMIYGPKTVQAFQIRKQNQENAALREHVAELEEELARRNAAMQHVKGKEAKDGEVSAV